MKLLHHKIEDANLKGITGNLNILIIAVNVMGYLVDKRSPTVGRQAFPFVMYKFHR